MNPQPAQAPEHERVGALPDNLSRSAGARGLAKVAIGPAFIASIAYVDPGNLATNVLAGGQYGFLLLWVVVVASFMAMLVQYLSAKLGVATGENLPEVCRRRFRPWVRNGLWVQAELVVIMTDLAELVGGAIALHLLFGVSLFVGALLMVGAAFVILGLRVRGRSGFRTIVLALLAVVLLAFVYQVVREPVSLRQLVGGFVPRLAGTDSTVLAAGIIGATVMPHVIYLHSGLTQGLTALRPSTPIRRLLRWSRADVMVAMSVAGGVNVAILVVATAIPASAASTLQDAYVALGTDIGAGAGLVFAVALLASGLAASCVGVYSGQVIMAGFIRRQIPIWVRRTVSAIPPLVVLGSGVDATRALVFSQVVLSFGIPFALIPLVVFTGDRAVMGILVNHRMTTMVAVLAVALIIALNVYLLGSLVPS
ncbi:MAG: Nramp family divalent metal transporter [Actinomycetes bacterium]